MASYPYPGPAAYPPPAATPAQLEKPTAAFVLSLIGGVFILLWGVAIAAVGAYYQSVTFGFWGGGLVAIGGLEAVAGLLVIVFGILLYVSPQNHVVYGVLVLVFSLVSLAGLGGAIIGFILGLIGGILGITHKPTPPSPTVVYVQPGQAMSPQPQAYYQQPLQYAPPGPVSQPSPSPPADRYCPVCGAGNARVSAFCSRCGKPLPPPS